MTHSTSSFDKTRFYLTEENEKSEGGSSVPRREDPPAAARSWKHRVVFPPWRRCPLSRPRSIFGLCHLAAVLPPRAILNTSLHKVLQSHTKSHPFHSPSILAERCKHGVLQHASCTHTGNGLLQWLAHPAADILKVGSPSRSTTIWNAKRNPSSAPLQTTYIFSNQKTTVFAARLVCWQVPKRSMSTTSGDQKPCPQAARPIDGTSYWKGTDSRRGRSPSISLWTKATTLFCLFILMPLLSPLDRSQQPSFHGHLPFSLVVWKDEQSRTRWGPRSGRDVLSKFGPCVHPDWVPEVISATWDKLQLLLLDLHTNLERRSLLLIYQNLAKRCLLSICPKSSLQNCSLLRLG